MDEIAQIQTEVRARLKTEGYDPYLYAILFSILTGVRAGEIPTLRWSDLSDMGIHIHTQQRIIRREGDSRLLEELPFTKNERRHPRGGRYFPVYDELQTLLNEIREQQDIDGIHSEFIFCCADGAWINKESYEQKLRRLCRKLDFIITNNHAFRMSFNSNILIPAGIPVTQRAYLLGHSVEVNERNYSFSRKEELKTVKNTLNSAVSHSKSLKNLISFPDKKIPQTLVE